MKKNLLRLLMTLLFVMTIDGEADECCVEESCCYVDENNFHAKIFGGANFLQNSQNRSTYQIGYVIAGSLGYRLCYGLSLEGEYAFRRNAINKIHFTGEGNSGHGHFQASSYMGNLLWDLPICTWGCAFWNIQPFIGGGIGYDSECMSSSNSRVVFHQKWNRFSWQLMAGVKRPLFCNTEMTLEYKFHRGGSHFNNHSIGVGLLYKFGL